MAKASAAAAFDAETDTPKREEVTVNTLEKGDRATFQALKRPVLSAIESFGSAREKVSEIAPRVMAFYRKLVGEYGLRSFPEFVRMFDPKLPTFARDKADGSRGYSNSRSFYTMDYMRRLDLARDRPKGRRGQWDAATDTTVRTLATVLQIIKDPIPFWAIVQAEFRLTPDRVAKLQKRVEKTKPLIKLDALMKPISISTADVVHMESTKDASITARAEAASTTTESLRGSLREVKRGALAQPGRRIRRRGAAAA